MGANFILGDLVWAKMKGFSYWPARIVDAESYDTIKVKVKAGHHCVFFFGSENVAWIPDDLIEFHNDSMIEKCPKKKTSALQRAIEEIVTLAETTHRSVQERAVDTESQSPEIKSNLKKRRRSNASTKSSTRKSQHVLKSGSNKKTVKKRRTDVESEVKKNEVKRKLVKSFEEYGILQSPADETSSSDIFDTYVSANSSSAVPDDAIFVSTYRSSFSSPIDEGERIPPKKIYSAPSNKKIGFIGLGMIGRGVVKNLMQSKHYVTVWDRTPENCERFVKRGAIKADTVAELVKASDIIFCCVSDSAAVKSLIFCQSGILSGLEGSIPGEKGYVEMTSIDPETSVEICEAITRRGGKYLESPLIGSVRDANDGELLSIAAGDISLFETCEPCFLAICRHSHYLSCKVGVGSEYNALITSMMGTFYGAISETLTFVERMKMGQKRFLDIIRHTGFGLQALMDKASEMARNEIVTDMPLNHQQEALEIAIVLSEGQQQSLNLTQSATELYKHSCLVGFSEKDVGHLCNSLK